MKNGKTLIVILGPTAIGKTALAIRLARHFNTEILSADSRQFFKELNIGVARPSEEELNSAPHHFIGSVSIHDHYSAGIFERDALALLEELFRTHDYVICAGGSGLYLNALLNGLDELPTNPLIRSQLAEIVESSGLEPLQEELKQRDPEYYLSSDIQNPHRVIRALEVCRITGKPYSSLRKRPDADRPFDVLKIGLTAERSVIYDRINKRVDKMMEEGLLEEARALHPFRELNSLNTVGYKELFDFIDGKISLEQAVNQIKQHTRNFAKRQMTWWRREEDIHWIETGEEASLLEMALKIIGEFS